MRYAELKDSSFVEADLSGADYHCSVVCDSDFSRASARAACFDEASLQRSKLVGGDFRDASFRECNMHSCDLKACLVVDDMLEQASGLKFASIDLRITKPHYCGFCGPRLQVWGTLALVEKHHLKMHPGLQLFAKPISVEDGCESILEAKEVGQAVWVNRLS